MPTEDTPPENSPAFDTLCAHWAEDRTRFHGAVVPPIFQNSLFTYADCDARMRMWESLGKQKEQQTETGWTPSEIFDYTRVSNPTTEITEAKIAALEGGEKARCFGSGMAAISAAILSCVKSGDHVIAVETIYGPTRQFLSDYLPRFGIETTYVDGRDTGDFARAIRPSTTLIYLESPSTFVFHQQDLSAVATLAKAHGISTICDNSWASPIFQNPLKHGIDLVLHSATKYLGGHSDVVAGVVAGSAARIDALVMQEGCLLGAVLDPFAAWLLLRGLRTLPIRMERHQQTTVKIAQWLRDHPKIAHVFYPGLPDAPQANITACQLRGTSGLLTITLKDRSKEATFRFVDALHYFSLGCSWGGFESLVMPLTLPSQFFGEEGEVHRWIVRLHIGLEGFEDIQRDLSRALEGV